jgi:AraC-like DNA-binding protein
LATIYNDHSSPWSVEEMAQIALLSRSKLARYFPSVMDMTPAEYLTKWRMSLAETVLRQTKSVKKTALVVGYSIAPAFIKAFTSNFGMLP